MLKTFLIGILLGILAAGAASYSLPIVDQYREVSLVSVAPNGGNIEKFQVKIPVDRIMVGTASEPSGFPAGMEWPTDDVLANVSAELFKLRNERDVVIGVAARTVAQDQDTDVIDWILHLPARGSLFVSMEADAQADGGRTGRVQAGTDEFGGLRGLVTERWIPDTSGEEDAPAGHIQLLATYVSAAEPRE